MFHQTQRMVPTGMRPILALAMCLSPLAASAADLTVFAAASLKTALDEIETAWESETGLDLVISLAGSSALARQIELGAPADLFISASPEWMDTLDAAGLIRPDTRRNLLTNDLVLVAHGPGAPALDPARLPAELDDGRLAMALVDAVPAGIYGKAALESLGLWPALEPKVAQADNVRAALALVAAGEAPFGIVYATDARAEPGVSVVATFPSGSHPPIVYPAAVTAEATSPHAEVFLDWLGGDTARGAFARQGFGVPAP